MRRLALAAVVALAGCEARPQDEIFIKGSDTMVGLLNLWADSFERTDEARVVHSGGGSSAGIHAVLYGLVDLAASSRPMTRKERRAAARKGLEVYDIEVARDGIVAIAHPDNPITALSQEQLAQVLTGEARQWSELGGAEGPIKVLNRNSSSGTRAFVRSRIMGGRDYTPRAKVLPSTRAIIQGVRADPNALGYVGLGAAARASVRALAILTPEPIRATPTTIRSGNYPLTRTLHFYAVVRPGGPVQRFLDHVQGPEGQKAVDNLGFVPR